MAATIQEEVPVGQFTTLRVGGTARYYLRAETIDDIRLAAAFAKKRQLPLFVLGGGSNTLVSDEGFSGMVIHVALRGKEVVKKDEDIVFYRVAAGEVLDEVIANTVIEGWWGLENLSAIPGLVGAAPVQNVGAYGVEAGSYIDDVSVFDLATLTIKTLSQQDCQFGYRDSLFKHESGRQYIVLAVTFRLSRTPQPNLHYKDLSEYFSSRSTPPEQKQIREAIVQIRSHKFPNWNEIGTAGSFFKNPVVPRAVAEMLQTKYPELPIYDAGLDHKKISLGYVLDKICHLKGYTNNGVALYEKQALVLVVREAKTANAVILFAKEITEKIFATIEVVIEWEVIIMR